MYLKVNERGRTLCVEKGDKIECRACGEKDTKKLYYCSEDKHLYCLQHTNQAFTAAVETQFYSIDQIEKETKQKSDK